MIKKIKYNNALYVLASEELNPDGFINEVKTEYMKLFPDCWILGNLQNSLGEKLIFLSWGIQPREKHANKIIQNDPGFHTLFVRGVDKATESFRPIIEAQIVQGGSIRVKSTTPIYRFDSVKIGWRNKKGNPQQILKHIINYFNKLRKVVDQTQELTE